jgi:hypothetical protein
LDDFSSENWNINLCGFTWEGWKRHAWADELRWAEGLVEKQGIKVWP